MLYPLSYEGITGFSSHAVVSSTTSAQHFRNNYSQHSTTPHYSSTLTVHDEYRICRSDPFSLNPNDTTVDEQN
jgi:hypothetical protein